MELRRDLSTSQQEVEQTRLDLQQRQDLLKSAAGEEMASPSDRKMHSIWTSERHRVFQKAGQQGSKSNCRDPNQDREWQFFKHMNSSHAVLYFAGEARREVLALRKHKEESERELTEATLRIAALEDEIRNLKGELSEAAESNTDDSNSRGFSSKDQRELDLKEAELHRLRANERVNAASKEALNAQASFGLILNQFILSMHWQICQIQAVFIDQTTRL